MSESNRYEITDSFATRAYWGQDFISALLPVPSVFRQAFLTAVPTPTTWFASSAATCLAPCIQINKAINEPPKYSKTKLDQGDTLLNCLDMFPNSNKPVQISSYMFHSLKSLGVFLSFWWPQSDTHSIYLRIYFSHDLTDSLLWHEELMEGSSLQVKHEEVQ